jgi:hypothetical protein
MGSCSIKIDERIKTSGRLQRSRAGGGGEGRSGGDTDLEGVHISPETREGPEREGTHDVDLWEVETRLKKERREGQSGSA